MKRFINILFFANLAWFISRVTILALHLAPGITPDEMYHLQVIDLYRNSVSLFAFTESWSTAPRPLPEFEKFGATAEYAYLYHMILGKLAAAFSLDVFNFDSIVFLRFTSILLSFLSLGTAYSFFRAAQLGPLHALVAVMIICNISCFTFVSSGVGYDNLLYYFSWLALLYFLRFTKELYLNELLKLLIALQLAMLTKFSALPFALLVGGCALMLLFINRKRCNMKVNRILYIPVVLVTLLNLDLYAGNAYQYGKIIPESQEVFSEYHEDNYQTRIDLDLISKNADIPRLGYVAYFAHWTFVMLERSLGLKGHKLIELPWEASLVVLLILLSTSFVFFKKLSTKDLYLAALFLLAVCYALFLAFYVNYGVHIVYGDVDIGINGRYMFLFLPVFVAVILRGVLKGGSEQGLRSSLLVFLVFFSIQFQVLYFDKSFAWLTSPPPKEFYYNVGYLPHPIYDENYNVINHNR